MKFWIKFIIFGLIFSLELNSGSCSTFGKFVKLFNTFGRRNKGIKVGVYEREHHHHREYDFIIVGASPSGCALANRLSENEDWKILLIEAGHFQTAMFDTPLMVAYATQTQYNWKFKSVTQDNACLGVNDKQCLLHKGKGVGGGTIINYMIYSRGHKEDFEHSKDYGWSYNDVLPYFKKFEGMSIKKLQKSDVHGLTGPVNIEYADYHTEFADSFIEASKSLGQQVVDYNSGEQLGVSRLQSITKNGHRNSAFKAYLEPILHRSNLDIMTRTYATKILINDKKRAVGVKVLRDGKTLTLRAKKEVILSAGTFKSAQLLMLSGIGPSDILNDFSIPIIKELPVGKNLQDHVSLIAPPLFILNTTSRPYDLDSSTIESIIEFNNGKGKLTVAGTIEALSFIRTDGAKTGVPDVEFLFSPTSFHSDKGYGFKRLVGLTDENYNEIYKPLEDIKNDVISLISVLLKPHMKGSVKLIDTDPLSRPQIDLKYLENSKDVDKFLETIKYMKKLMKEPAFKKYDPKLHDIPIPSCKHLKFDTDDYWKCAIKAMTGSLWHYVGTCKMGPKSDVKSVVSPKLKVHGIKHLRVADCSIIPEITRSHTTANAYMIGEKAADLIKDDWE